MDLNAIKFNVETGELARAISEIDKVAKALGDMSVAVKDATKTKQDSVKVEKESITLSKEAAKLKEAEAKASKAVADAEAAEARAKVVKAKASNDSSEATKKATKAQGDLVESLSGTDRILAKQALSMQILRGEIVNTADGFAYLGSGFSKSQSGMLANLQLLGATGKEMQTLARSFEDYNRITGLNTFDKSASGVSKLKKELAELNSVNRLASEGLNLTRDELVNYMRDSERLVQQMKSEGRSTEWLAEEQKQLKLAYVTTSTELNKLRAESKRMEDQAKQQARAEIQAANDRAKAQNFVAQEMNRVNAAYLAAVGDDKLNVSTSNRLLKMEQALKATGMSAQQAEAQLAQYKRTLTGVQKASSDRAVDTISRALGPQITDITVGLATGQSLMTVLLQQGGQLRDQMVLAGVAADQMGMAIRKAGSEMVSSVWATGKGVISGIAGAFLDLGLSAGKGLASGVANMQRFRASLYMSEKEFENFSKGLDSAFTKTGRFTSFMETSKVAASLFAGGIAIATAAIIALTVAFVQLSKEQDRLAVSFSLNSAQLGLTASSAYTLAQSYAAVGINTRDAVDGLESMAKAGAFTRSQVEELLPSIVKLNKAAGEDMQTTVARFTELGKDPVKALYDLQKTLGTVPPEMIKAAIEARNLGDGMKAMEIATSAAKVAAEQAAKNIQLYYSPLGQLFKNLKQGASDMWAAITGVVEGKSAKEKLAGAESGLLKMQAALEKAKKDAENTARTWGGSVSASAFAVQEANVAAARAEVKKWQDIVNQEIAAGQRKAVAAQEAEAKSYADSILSPLERAKRKVKSGEYDIGEYIVNSIRLKDPKGAFKKGSEEYAYLAEQAKKEFEDIVKKSNSSSSTSGSSGSSRRPTSPGLFDLSALKTESSNALDLIRKDYDAAAAIRENNYKSGQISLGNFLTSEIQAIKEQSDEKRAIYANEIAKLDQQEKTDLAALEAWKSNLTENEDKLRAQKQIEQVHSNYKKMRETAQSQIIGLVDDTAKAVAKAMEELVKLASDSVKLYQDFTKGIQERQAARQLEIQDQQLLMNLSGSQLAAEKARLAEVRATSNQISDQIAYVEKLKNAYDELKKADPTSPQSEQAFKAWQEAQARVAKMKQDTEAAAGKAAVDAVNLYQMQEYQKLKQGIADALETALFEGGKSGSKKLRALLMAELRKPITVVINAVANVITDSIGAFLGLSKSGSTGNSLNSIAGFAQAGKSAYDAITGGFTGMTASAGSAITNFGMKFGSTSIAEFGQGVSMSAGGGVGATGGAEAASTIGGSTQAGFHAGTAATTVAAYMVGSALKDMISGGYKINPNKYISFLSPFTNEAVQNIAIAIGSAINPALGVIIGAGAGLVNRAFGRKLKQVGIQGTFSGNKFEGTQYTFEKGGWFRDDKTRSFALDQETKTGLGNAFALVKNQFVSLAKWFGTETVASVENYSKYIKVNLKGKSQDQIDKIFEDLFAGVSEEMAKLTLAGTDFAKKGETAVQTLDRLKANLLGVNQVIDTLGMTFFKVSLASADTASSLVDLFGGLDKFQTATASYYEKFYSEEEKLSTATRQLTTTFAAMGLTLPATREAFKDIVSAQDLTTASGQLTFQALIGLSDVFYEITSPLEEATQKMKDFTSSILEYVNSLSMSQGSASQNLAYAKAMFSQQLMLAKAGDQNAMDNITSYSDKLIELAKASSGSPVEFDTILGSVKAELLGLTTGVSAGTVLASGMAPAVLPGTASVTTANQIVEQTATTQQLLTSILTKLTEMQAGDRAEGSQNVVNLNAIAKVVKRIDNGDSIRTFAVTV